MFNLHVLNYSFSLYCNSIYSYQPSKNKEKCQINNYDRKNISQHLKYGLKCTRDISLNEIHKSLNKYY